MRLLWVLCKFHPFKNRVLVCSATALQCLWDRRIHVESLSFAPAAGKALAGASSPHRAVCGAMQGNGACSLSVLKGGGQLDTTESAGHQGVSWTPGGQLDTRGSLCGRCQLCLSMNFQGVGYSHGRAWEMLWWWFMHLLFLSGVHA